MIALLLKIEKRRPPSLACTNSAGKNCTNGALAQHRRCVCAGYFAITGTAAGRASAAVGGRLAALAVDTPRGT